MIWWRVHRLQSKRIDHWMQYNLVLVCPWLPTVIDRCVEMGSDENEREWGRYSLNERGQKMGCFLHSHTRKVSMLRKQVFNCRVTLPYPLHRSLDEAPLSLHPGCIPLFSLS